MDLLDAYVEAGGNFIDTADMYGPDQTRRSCSGASSCRRVGRGYRALGARPPEPGPSRYRHQGPSTDVGRPRWARPVARPYSHRRRGQPAPARNRDDRSLSGTGPDDQVPVDETLATFQELIDVETRYVGSNFPPDLLQRHGRAPPGLAGAPADRQRAASLQPGQSFRARNRAMRPGHPGRHRHPVGLASKAT